MTKADLILAILVATQERTILVPSSGWYSTKDYYEDTLYYIDPQTLIQQLERIGQND